MKPPSVQKSIDARPEERAARVVYWLFVFAAFFIFINHVVMR